MLVLPCEDQTTKKARNSRRAVPHKRYVARKRERPRRERARPEALAQSVLIIRDSAIAYPRQLTRSNASIFLHGTHGRGLLDPVALRVPLIRVEGSARRGHLFLLVFLF